MVKDQNKQREELHKLLDQVPAERLVTVESLLKQVLNGKLQPALDANTYRFWLDNDGDEEYERMYRDKI
jgi:DNA-binding transcriptional regulator YdaS (Cro superfamily)